MMSLMRLLKPSVKNHAPVICRSKSGLSQWLVSSGENETRESQLRSLRRVRHDMLLKQTQFPSVEFKIAGVSFDNRQSVLERTESGDALIFERETYNEFDPDAVRICLLDGSRLGYVPRDKTSLFGRLTTAGRVKSIGKGEGGFYGALAFVQPRLPYLLPGFLPEEIESEIDPLKKCPKETQKALLRELKEPETCCITGLSGQSAPCSFWRFHSDRKEIELSGIKYVHKDVLSVMYMKDGQDNYLIELLSVLNGSVPLQPFHREFFFKGGPKTK